MPSEHVKDYITLSDCYDVFNDALFDGQLRGCVLTFEDRGQHFGYYRKGGFIARDGGERRDEICLNPRHFLANTGDLELLQTLVHEQVHQWQFQFGKPSLRTYHNREWADKMLSIGLTPSSTGRPGGKMTGQHMADYPTEGGLFLQVAQGVLAKSSLITWYKEGVAIKRAQEYAARPDLDDQTAPGLVAALAANLPAAGDEESKPSRTPSKVAYQCQECGVKVWGKPSLSLICGDCHGIDGRLLYLASVSNY
ncbi:SprT-like domain-containing protein [Haloferula chungangensis]|uniref:SprT-like domain-containing protein n=1 Tax=Haloferula chungangensis TaxID=1048331 RepID=A0ABW2LAQ0_9BACT